MSKRRKKEIENGKKVDKWKVEMVSRVPVRHLRDLLAVQYEFWSVRNTTERIDAMILLSKDCKRDTEHPIYKIINRMFRKKVDLFTFHKKNFGKCEVVDKSAIVWDIVARFYGETSPLERRKNEEKNITSVNMNNLEKEFDFVTVCDITVPHEIVTSILVYLDRNFDVLVNVGGTCQLFYLFLLSSWNVMKITKNNVHNLSTFALKNVRRIDLGKITVKQQQFLWERVSASKLREIRILQNYGSFDKTALKNLRKRSNKEIRKNLVNVTKLVYNSYEGGNLNDTFPNLTVLEKYVADSIKIKDIQKCKKIHTLSLRCCTGPQIIPNLKHLKNLFIKDILPMHVLAILESLMKDLTERKITLDTLNLIIRKPSRGWDDQETFTTLDLSNLNGKLVKKFVLSRDSYYMYADKNCRLKYPVAGNFQEFNLIPLLLEEETTNITTTTKKSTAWNNNESNNNNNRFWYFMEFNIKNIIQNLFEKNTIKKFVADIPLNSFSNDFSAEEGLEETKLLENNIVKFVNYLSTSVVSKFDHFEFTITKNNQHYLSFKYEKNVPTTIGTTIKRFVVKFSSCHSLTVKIQNYYHQFFEEEGEVVKDIFDPSKLSGDDETVNYPLECILKKFIDESMEVFAKNREVDCFEFNFGLVGTSDDDDEKVVEFQEGWRKYIIDQHKNSGVFDIKEEGILFLRK